MMNKRLESHSRKTKKFICPLEDPNIGIISENDHQVGLCLCKFCICNKHKCTRKNSPSHLNSSFRTTYSADFQNSKFDFNLKQADIKPFKDSRVIPIISTHQESFKPFKTKPKAPKTVYWSPSPGPSSNITSYNSHFPKWETPKVNYEKRFNAPPRLDEVRFRSSSSYQSSYQQHLNNATDNTDDKKLSVVDRSKLIWDNDLKKEKNSNHFSILSDPKQYRSNYNEHMQDYSKNEFNKIKIEKAPNPPLFSDCKVDYNSTFKTSYQRGESLQKDPRQLKMIFQRNNNKFT